MTLSNKLIKKINDNNTDDKPSTLRSSEFDTEELS